MLTEQRQGKNRGYAQWAERCVDFDEGQRAQVRACLAELSWRPTVSIVMPVWKLQEALLHRAVESVRRQLYSEWELCMADDASENPATRAALESYELPTRTSVVPCKSRRHFRSR